MYRRLTVLSGLALATLVASAQAQTVTLRYGQIANSARGYSSLGLYVAQRKGFLAREGIELKVVRLPGLHTMVEAVDKDDVELAHTATPFLVQAGLKEVMMTATGQSRRLRGFSDMPVHWAIPDIAVFH